MVARKHNSPYLFVLLASLLAMLASPASAQGTDASAAKAKTLFARGNQAFNEGRYSDALASYGTSFDLVERPRTLFNIAVCRDRLGQLEAAYVSYQKFMAIAETRDAKLLSKAKARLAELQLSLRLPVALRSNPAGASIVVVNRGERVEGLTPRTIELNLGKHLLRFEAKGHRSQEVEVEVIPGRDAHLDVRLEALARIKIIAQPSAARVSIVDSKGEAITNDAKHFVEPGSYQVTVELEDYVAQEFEVVLAGGESLSRQVSLMPTTTAASRPADGGTVYRYAALGSAVLGVAALGVAVSQGLSAQDDSDRAQSSARAGTWDPGAYDKATTAQTRMFIFAGIGTAAALGGGLLYYLGHRADHEPPSHSDPVQPLVGPNTAGLSLAGRF